MNYRYLALDRYGQLVRGDDLADDLEALAALLRERQLELVRARALRRHFRRRPTRRDLMHFCFQLEQLSTAGVPLLDGLRDLRDDPSETRLHELLAGIVRGIEGGQLLSHALARRPEAFPPLLTGLIAAGEHSGRLPEILRAIGDKLRWDDELAAQTGKALLYPGIVLVVVGSVTVFLLFSVVPQLQAFVAQSGTPPDFASRSLFFVSAALREHWPVLAGLLATAIAVVPLALRHPAVQDRADDILGRLPVIGRIRRDIDLSRFAATFGLLYGAGIPVLDALERTGATLAGRRLRRALAAASQSIHGGRSIADACAASGLFPPLPIRMLRIGEHTGQLENVLGQLAYLYQRDAREALTRLQALLEPALTVLLGLLLGWIMLAVLGPIYDIVGRVRL